MEDVEDLFFKEKIDPNNPRHKKIMDVTKEATEESFDAFIKVMTKSFENGVEPEIFSSITMNSAKLLAATILEKYVRIAYPEEMQPQMLALHGSMFCKQFLEMITDTVSSDSPSTKLH